MGDVASRDPWCAAGPEKEDYRLASLAGNRFAHCTKCLVDTQLIIATESGL
jgi:hypothetical protein